ncbi:MAG: DUF4198 domain-containing protein [Novosphingobium sp.]|nr:DUF4198 domain-containing protein [Novosphingobium sp.]
MKRKFLLAGVALFSSSPLFAHNPWIKPSATNVAGEDGWVTFDAGASTDVYNPDHAAMPLDQIKAYAPDGSEARLENGMRGKYRTTFDLHLTGPGTWRVGTQSLTVMGSYKLDGQEYRVGGRGGPRPGGAAGGPAGTPGGDRPGGGEGGRGGPGGNERPQGDGPAPIMVPATPDFGPPAGATDVKLILAGSRNEVFVTLGSPTEIKLSDQGLEMQPITQPADLVSDEPGRFRFLVDGKPAAGLEVEAIPDGRKFRNDQGTITATTDANGEATIAWTGPGLYWVHADFKDDTSPRPGITGRRFQYTANLEVSAP